MSERKDERWLDEQLRRAIDVGRPEFDAEAWKREHREAYQAVLSRRDGDGRGDTRPHPFRLFANPLFRSAVAATIVVAAGLVLWTTRPNTPEQVERPSVSRALVSSPTDIVTFMSLTMAYRQGGEEALNRQLDAALETLGPRPDVSLLNDVLNDLEG